MDRCDLLCPELAVADDIRRGRIQPADARRSHARPCAGRTELRLVLSRLVDGSGFAPLPGRSGPR